MIEALLMSLIFGQQIHLIKLLLYGFGFDNYCVVDFFNCFYLHVKKIIKLAKNINNIKVRNYEFRETIIC